MVCVTLILAVTSLLLAAAEGDVPAPVVAGVVSSLQRHFLSGCVFLLHTAERADMDFQEVFRQLLLRKRFSEETTQVAAIRLRPDNTSLECSRNIPLNVILSSDTAARLTLLEFSNRQNLARAKWLLFLTEGNVDSFFADIYVPFNCEFLVARPTKNSVALFDVYRVALGKPLNDIYFGRWTRISGLAIDKASIYLRRSDLQGTVIQAVTADDPPIVAVRNDRTDVDGFFGRVWKILEEKMNFRTNYTVITDLTKGNPLENHDCSGMIGILECAQFDMALGAFSTSSYPTVAVRFSMPLIHTTYRVFIRKPAGRKADWNAYLMPFNPHLWMVLIATILFIALYLSTFYRIGRLIGNEEAGGPELYTFYDSILYIFGAFCQQGHDITPRSTSCRLVYITAYFTALVLLAAYSAELISSLTVYRSNLPFQDLEGILRDKTYKLGVTAKSEMYYTVSDETKNNTFKQLYEKLMAPDSENFPLTTLGALQRVCGIKYAFIGIPESVMPLLKKVNCSIVQLPYKTYPVGLAMAFSPSSPYTDFWSFRLRMLRDGGIVHRLRLNNWPYLGQDTVKSTTVGVDLRAVAPLLILLSSSVVVSIVVLTLERGKFAFCNKRSQNATRRERNIYRQRSVFKTTTPSNPTYPVFDISKNESTAYGFQ